MEHLKVFVETLKEKPLEVDSNKIIKRMQDVLKTPRLFPGNHPISIQKNDLQKFTQKPVSPFSIFVSYSSFIFIRSSILLQRKRMELDISFSSLQI